MNTDAECIFCKIVSGEIPSFKVYEDAMTLAFMDINPANDGHCLVIPKEHSRDLYVIPEGVLSAVSVTASKIARAVHKTLSPEGLNLVQCNGAGAAQSVFHFHMHVLPRRDGDELKLNWGIQPGDRGAIEALAGRIRAAL